MILRVASNLVRASRCPSRVAAVVLVAAAVHAGCSASSTTTVTPTGPDSVKCQVSLANPSVVDASGGAARFSVATQPECAWEASSAANWISGLSPASGQGNGDVEFRVAANDGSSAREGEIVVNDSRVRVSQRAPCRYNVGPQNQSVNAGADAGSVTVATESECTWTATTDVGWIRLSPPLAGSGNGTVGFTVASNGGAQRTGSVIIAGQQAVVTQAAAAAPPCTFTISPTSQSIAVAGGEGTAVTVSTQAGCRWTAASHAPGSPSRPARVEPEMAQSDSPSVPILGRHGRDAHDWRSPVHRDASSGRVTVTLASPHPPPSPSPSILPAHTRFHQTT